MSWSASVTNASTSCDQSAAASPPTVLALPTDLPPRSTIILQSLCPPSEDFGSPNEHLGKHPRKHPSHVATIFCNHLAKFLQKIVASQKHVATIFCNHLAKLLQKIIAYKKNQTHVATIIFCNHRAKLLQKIVAS